MSDQGSLLRAFAPFISLSVFFLLFLVASGEITHLPAHLLSVWRVCTNLGEVLLNRLFPEILRLASAALRELLV